MSNHSGSYLLNDVLNLCAKRGILDKLEKEEKIEFIKDIVKIGYRYDCNSGEILEYIGEEYNICYVCLEEKEDLEDGICKDC